MQQKSVLILFFSFIHFFSYAQQAPKLIVRGDDMGSSRSANLASIDTYVNGIETSIELMVVTPWFPEAAKMLEENTGIDVGLHLVITSEWDGIKWRPLTHCPSLTDDNGYFFPMMGPNENYPGLAVIENQWKLNEIEQEFRAQIELGLKNVPQVSHLSGHMGSTSFHPDVAQMVLKLSAEYDLPVMNREVMQPLGIIGVSYDGAKGTFSEKEASFIRMLDNLEPGKSYMFVDHPSYDNVEMQGVGHHGYENVAEDRQGVTDIWTSQKVKEAISNKGVELVNFITLSKALPRSDPEEVNFNSQAIIEYLNAVNKNEQDLHSLMILRNGKVVFEEWFGENAANKTHTMYSVSKTFTATAIGFAVQEDLLKVTDKVISFFPEKLPNEISDHLQALEIRHLLTMTVGHDVDPTGVLRETEGLDWVEGFLAFPLEHPPGTTYVYNSLATYMLSAILTKVSGERILDFLQPRLYRPLGIVGATWDESPQGIQIGGWGLNVKTEDMAKLGQFYLQKGKWNGVQLLSESWINEASSAKVPSLPAGVKKEDLKVKANDSDWLQGYGYQLWRSRHNSYRADGRNGQFILVLPEKNAVIVTTADIPNMQAELNLIWDHLLPAFK
ncbi:Beta-lactamase class C and other penicillin binding protein [Indibacter alkaliphilus LW1]|uniref:Beta-lactamase class C and other penicillin binding protein n=1 Tax=Indibacter alkaliphilus (strain CCUG 57479 / KCTC 22604 / LW1) TaxID=1189612 RepID=S2DKT1_INDAL|nr:serine hydrolase [Indibacter alkaliphilus]EOZ97840.1 Beta-lactamase class C and other penicillin binding protein [Indibacter alkaliphilus LW1]